MPKKLQATAEQVAPGVWSVTVTDVDAKQDTTVIINAATEKDAAFKAMEQINDQ